MRQLETERLLIKPLTSSQAEAVWNVYKQAADYLELQTTEPLSLAMARSDIEAASLRGSEFVGLFERTSNELIGVADFVPKNFRGQPDYAWLNVLLIRQSNRRQGYGTEAYRVIEEYIFDDPVVTRIGQALLPQFEPSLRFAEQMGFERAGGPFKNKRGYGLYSFVKKRPGLPETPGEKIWRAAQNVKRDQ
jgi:RimJ/RimL family protein N-acetyltransferase